MMESCWKREFQGWQAKDGIFTERACSACTFFGCSFGGVVSKNISQPVIEGLVDGLDECHQARFAL